jgi:hypothetical protein
MARSFGFTATCTPVLSSLQARPPDVMQVDLCTELILLKGNALGNITPAVDPQKNFMVIMMKKYAGRRERTNDIESTQLWLATDTHEG